MKKLPFFSLVFFLVVLATGCGTKYPDLEMPIGESDQIFFYGEGCPHCAIVEDFMKETGVAEKIGLKQGEIYHNKKNAEIFKEKAAGCGIDEKEMGVPMLWQGGKCYIGDKEIVAYFKNLIDKK